MVKESACNAGDPGLSRGPGRSPEGGPGNPTSVLFPREPQGQRSLAGYSPWGHTESDTIEATKHNSK